MEIAIIILVAALLLIGLIGTIVPVLPGTGLVFLGILAYALYFGIETVGLVTLIILGIAAALSFLFDYLGSAYGAKRYGSTAWGVAGAILGGIVGMIILNIIGLILGIFSGAALAELLFARRDMGQSLRIGWGSVVGFLGGTILKFLLGLVMIVVFLARVAF